LTIIGQKCYIIDMKKFDELYDLAEGNFGLITYAQAKKLGISIRELDRWVKGGRLERPARGLYRVCRFAVSELDPFAIATETVGSKAYLYGESVLGMLGLVPTNPTWVYVATPGRIRRKLGEGLRLVKGEEGYVPTNYNGVRAQYLADAIRACRATVRPDRRIRAAEEGLRQGYLLKAQCRELIREIKREAAA